MATENEALSRSESINKRKRREKERLANAKRPRTDQNGVDQHPPAGPDSAVTKTRKTKPEKHQTLQEVTVALLEEDDADSGSVWKVSEPMGGRMANIDPIFTPDEEYIILTYNTSIQIYGTSDSLLVRRIPLPVPPSSHIVSVALSETRPTTIWVACQDGALWHIDWTTGDTLASENLPVSILGGLVLATLVLGQEEREAIVTSEYRKGSTSYRLAAYDPTDLSQSKDVAQLPGTNRHSAVRLQTGDRGKIIAATFGRSVMLGIQIQSKVKNIFELHYSVHGFDVADDICSMDLRITLPKVSKKKVASAPVVDLAVGCLRGAIYLFSGVLGKLEALGSSGRGAAGALHPRRTHWHRNHVTTVKWSRDGNYLVSGGTESTLVLLQLDTFRQEYLPHLGASVQNVVVSPRGSSYAIHLDDNSTMVISTAEMKPTAYISGLQLLTAAHGPEDKDIRRVWKRTKDFPDRLPAAINPKEPSQLFLATGSGDLLSSSGTSPSAPLLQTFDLASFQSVSKQPLARTLTTDNNATTHGYPLTEPMITSLAITSNGEWAASIDTWAPPFHAHVTEAKGLATEIWSKQRTETYLKFWKTGAAGADFELVTRIDDAHFTQSSNVVLDLAADPKEARFATVGDDGVVRFWVLKNLRRDGLAVTGSDGQPLVVWSCSHSVSLGESSNASDEGVVTAAAAEHQRHAALTFSEDGSILFAAFGSDDDASVFVVDTETGRIRLRLNDMFKGTIRGIGAIGASLILLSDYLNVYNIVLDELQYGIALNEVSEGAQEHTYLAVDRQSGTFALAVPEESKKRQISTVAVFSPEAKIPLLIKTVPALVTSLLPATGSAGYIAIDASSQVWSVATSTEASVLARPLADLQLDTVETDVEDDEMELTLQLENGHRIDGEVEGDNDAMDLEDDHVHHAIIAPQRLTDIFDAAPAFAMPPIEDLFYKVADLCSLKPLQPEAEMEE